MKSILKRFFATAFFMVYVSAMSEASSATMEQAPSAPNPDQPFYVVRVTNNFSAKCNCAFSEIPTWGECTYTWDGKEAETTKSKTSYYWKSLDNTNSDKPFEVSLKMEYHINHFGNHSEQKTSIQITPDLVAIDPVKDTNHCGLNTESVSIQPSILVDGPVCLKLDNDEDRFVVIDDKKGVTFLIESNNNNIVNAYEIQWKSGEENWQPVTYYIGECTYNGRVTIRFEDIFGGDLTEEYLNHIEKPISFRVVKKMINGCFQNSEIKNVYFFKKAPKFSLEEVYAPSCYDLAKYAIVKLDNANEQVFIEEGKSKWGVLIKNKDKERCEEVKSISLYDGRYRLDLSAISLNPDDVADFLQLSGFEMVNENTNYGADAESFNKNHSLISQPVLIALDKDKFLKVAQPKVEQNTSLRDYYGGYDEIRTGESEEYYVNLDITNYSEEPVTTIWHRKSDINGESNNTNVQKYESMVAENVSDLKDVDEQKLKKKFGTEVDSSVNTFEWKLYYRNNYFERNFKGLKPVYTQIPSVIDNEKVKISQNNIVLLTEICDANLGKGVRISHAPLDCDINNYYLGVDLYDVPSTFVSKWSQNVETNNCNIRYFTNYCYYEKEYSNAQGFETISHCWHTLSSDKYSYYNPFSMNSLSISYGGSISKELKQLQNNVSYTKGVYLNKCGAIVLLRLIGSGNIAVWDMNLSYDYPYSLGISETYIESKMNNNGKSIAILCKSGGSYKLYGTKSGDSYSYNVKSWSLRNEISIEGVDDEYIYIKDTNNNTYKVPFGYSESWLYLEIDKEDIFNQWMKERRGYDEVLKRYVDGKFNMYVSQNYGTKLKVEPNTKYDVYITDSDGCESEHKTVEVKVPSKISLNVAVDSNPTSECAPDGKVTFSVVDNGVTLKIRREGQLNYENLEYGKTMTYDDMSITDNVIYYRFIGQEVDYKLTVAFDANFPKPSIEEIIPKTNCNDGVLKITNYEPSNEYILCPSVGNGETAKNDGECFSVKSAGYYNSGIVYNTHGDGCYSEFSDTEHVKYRVLKINEIKVVDAKRLGGNGSVTISAGIYNGDEVDNSYSYIIEVDQNKQWSCVNNSLTISSIAAGEHMVRLYACDKEGEIRGNGCLEQVFTIGQPNVNVTFESVVAKDGSWRINKKIIDNNSDNLKLMQGNSAIGFDSELDKSATYKILFYDQVLVDNITCPSQINQPTSENNGVRCAGESVTGFYKFSEKLIFSGKEESSDMYNYSTSEKQLSFEATRKTTKNLTVVIPQSSVTWMEKVTQEFIYDVPVISKVEVNIDSKAQLDCVDKETAVLIINEIKGGADDLKYYFKAKLDNKEILNVPIRGWEIKEYTANDPFTYTTNRTGLYTFEIYQGNCQSDVTKILKVDNPQPIKISKSVRDQVCEGQSNGSVEIEISGGNAGETFGYACLFPYDDSLEESFRQCCDNDNAVEEIKSKFGSRKFENLDANENGYKLRVYDENLCYEDEIVIINPYTNPTFQQDDISSTSVTCNGGEDGNITIDLSKIECQKEYNSFDDVKTVSLQTLICKDYLGEVETYDVSNGGVFTIPSRRAGQFEIRVKDSEGCESASVVSNVNEPMKVELKPSNITQTIKNYNGTGGYVELTASGGNNSNGYTLYIDGVEQEGTLKENEPKSLGNIFTEKTYTFDGKDTKGCQSGPVQIAFEGPDTPLTFEYITTPAACKAATGTMTITPSGGWGAPYKVGIAGNGLKLEREPDSSVTFESLLGGTYEVAVTDKEGGMVSGTVTIDDNVIEAIYTKDVTTCNNDGSVTLKISGGNLSVGSTYKITNTKTDEVKTGSEVSFDKLSAGEYIFEISDNNGCTNNATITVKDGSMIVEPEVVSFATTNESADGKLSAIVSKGSGDYTYSWVKVDEPNKDKVVSTSKTAENLSVGVYQLEVLDGVCAYKSGLITLTSYISDILRIVKIGQQTKSDENDGSVCIERDGDIGGRKIELLYESYGVIDVNPIVVDNRVMFSDLKPGNYSVKIVGEDDKFEGGVSFTIEKYEEMQLEVGNKLDVSKKGYSDGSIQLTLKGGVAPYVIMVDEEPVEMINNSFTLENLTAGIYNVKVTDAFNNVLSKTYEIKEPESDLSFSYSMNPVSCYALDDGLVQLVAKGGWRNYQYRINGGKFGNSPYFPNLEAGTYSFEVMDGRGVTYAREISVTQPEPLEVVKVVTEDVSCKGLSDGAVHIVVEGGNGGYKIQKPEMSDWLDGTSYDSQRAGTYLFNINDSKGCSVNSIEAVIEEPEALVITAMDVTNTTCSKDNGSIVVTSDGGTLPYSYQWTENGVLMSDITPNVSGLKQGGYYDVEVTDKNGCKDKKSSVIEKSTIPRVKAVKSDPVLCYGSSDGRAWVEESDVEVAYPASPYHIYWENGEEGMSTSGLASGVHKVLIKDDNGCESEKSFDVMTPSLVTIDLMIRRDATCYGYSDAKLRVEGRGGVGEYSYQWSQGSSTEVADNLKAGEYKVIVTDANNCVAEDVYEVSEPEQLTVYAGEDITICPGNTYLFSTGIYSTYEWKNGKDEVLSRKNTFEASEEGAYHLTVTDEAGCFAHDDVSLTIGNDALKTDFLMPASASIEEEVVIIELSNMELDNKQWDYPTEVFTDVTNEDDESYILRIKPNSVGTYEVSLWANSSGCTSSRHKTIEIVSDAEDEEIVSDLGYDPIIRKFVVSPNPTSGLITAKIELRDKLQAEVRIYDVTNGRMVRVESLSDDSRYSVQFDLSTEISGIYLVTLDAEREHRSVKIIVK